MKTRLSILSKVIIVFLLFIILNSSVLTSIPYIPHFRISDNKDVAYYINSRNFIKLEKGTYSLSCIDVSRNFTIEGEGSEKTIIKASCLEALITINEGNIILKGITVVGNGLTFLRALGRSRVTLLDVRVIGFRSGVELRDRATLIANNVVIGDFRKAGVITFDDSQVKLGNAIIYSGKGLIDETTGLLAKDVSQIELVNTVIRDINGNGIVGLNNAFVNLVNVIVEDCNACAIKSEDNAKIAGRGFLQGNNFDLCGGVSPNIRIAKVSQTLKDVVRIPEDYTDLQEAIDAVRPEGSIVVIGGSYPSVTVWKDVNIVGYRSPVIKGLSVLKGVKLSLEGVRISNNEYAGIISYGHLRLVNSKIAKNYRGVEVKESSILELINVNIVDNYREGIYARDNSSIFLNSVIIKGNNLGLDVRDRVALMISDSVIQNNQKGGINVLDRPFLYLRNVTITNHPLECGIYSSSSPLILLENSNVEDNEVGLKLKGESILVALNSLIKNNKVCDIIYEDKSTEVSLLNTEVLSLCPQNNSSVTPH